MCSSCEKVKTLLSQVPKGDFILNEFVAGSENGKENFGKCRFRNKKRDDFLRRLG